MTPSWQTQRTRELVSVENLHIWCQTCCEQRNSFPLQPQRSNRNSRDLQLRCHHSLWLAESPFPLCQVHLLETLLPWGTPPSWAGTLPGYSHTIFQALLSARVHINLLGMGWSLAPVLWSTSGARSRSLPQGYPSGWGHMSGNTEAGTSLVSALTQLGLPHKVARENTTGRAHSC